MNRAALERRLVEVEGELAEIQRQAQPADDDDDGPLAWLRWCTDDELMALEDLLKRLCAEDELALEEQAEWTSIHTAAVLRMARGEPTDIEKHRAEVDRRAAAERERWAEINRRATAARCNRSDWGAVKHPAQTGVDAAGDSRTLTGTRKRTS